MANYGLVEKKVIKVGDPLPSNELTEGTPLTRVSLSRLSSDRKIIVFGVLGAFIPGCSKSHLPGFISKYRELKKKGYDEIFCVTVNDIFVTQAWGREQRAEGKVRILSDPDCEFTKAMGLEIHLPTLGGFKSKCYTMIVQDGIVKQLFIEPDGMSLSCATADSIIF